ncbi:hypothetical protein [Rhodococcus sp. ZPP]|uniref:hypothetical protein n=1 Tax=Rhodococcus sp. ZPP TaxID=2749906 RepID=UPI00244DE24C|nr:hypothetical protein [Rhodococcus sp. ZPP]
MRNPEVHHLHRSGISEHNVRRLHISVNNSAFVSVLQRTQHVTHDVDEERQRKRAIRAVTLLQGLPRNKLHDEEMRSLAAEHILTQVVHMDDRWVVEAGNNSRFPTKSLQAISRGILFE